MRRACLVLLLLSGLAFAGEAGATEVIAHDDQGRQIRFDVRAEGVDAEWFATLLRAAPHGDEISTVRIDIVSWDELRSTGGRAASGCYSRNTMVVPAEQTEANAHTVVHEYGHHLDRSRPVTGAAEPNGTPEWWRDRRWAFFGWMRPTRRCSQRCAPISASGRRPSRSTRPRSSPFRSAATAASRLGARR